MIRVDYLHVSVGRSIQYHPKWKAGLGYDLVTLIPGVSDRIEKARRTARELRLSANWSTQHGYFEAEQQYRFAFCAFFDTDVDAVAFRLAYDEPLDLVKLS